MKTFYIIFIIWTSLMMHLKCSQDSELLSSRNFQKEYLQKLTTAMETAANDYLNHFLREVEKPANITDDFDKELKLALNSKILEPKIVLIKQYLDLDVNKHVDRENMYAMRNVIFIKKLKDKLAQINEESFDEMYQLRYFYLCKKFKANKRIPAPYHNYYSKGTQLASINKQIVGQISNNQTVFVSIKEFGIELYKKVNQAGSDVIDDYLTILRKLLLEVMEPQSEEETSLHSEALRKILLEINSLLNTSDFYTKRQQLYDYLQNHLAVDFEEIQNHEGSQHDLIEISIKLKEKGLDLVMAYLFSNFEFIDYLQEQWQILLPQAPISLYDPRSRPLKQIQQLYDDFKLDFENSTKYEAYLEAVKLLHEQTRQDNTDSSHIYELLYSASQNVGSSRATLMNAKCNEI